MTKRIMIIVLYVIAAAIMLLSGLCLIGLTQSLHISKPEPVFTTTEPTVTEEAFIMKQNEPTVIHIKKENEDKLLSWESSDESIVEVDSGGRLDAYTTGVAEITARYKDGSETVYTVTVEEAEKKPERNIFSTAITANEDILERNELGNQDLYHILVNREQNIVTVYTYDDDGEYTVPVRAMVCSCGLDKGTITGEFETYFKKEWHALYDEVYGKYVTGIDGNFLFHSVPYTELLKNDSLESDEYNKLGTDASLGCVRLAVSDAKWIYDNCPVGTSVKIYDSDETEPLGKPVPMRVADLKIGWDPTDNEKDNPYNGKTPEIKLPESTSVHLGDDYNIYRGVTATDSCGNDITDKIEAIGNVISSRRGEYKITYRVTDALNRSAEQSLIIWVE